MYSCGGGSASRAFDKSLNEICRVCFSRKCAVLNVYETTLMNQTTIADMFMLFLGEYMYPDDDLPHFICCDCIEEVIETGNVSKECKDAVSYVVWRARVLKSMEQAEYKNSMKRRRDLMPKEGDGIEHDIALDVSDHEFYGESYPLYQNDFKSDNELGLPLECINVDLHQCNVCHGVFLSAIDLKCHKNMFHKTQAGLSCGSCWQKFRSQRELTKHILTFNFHCKYVMNHLNIRPFTNGLIKEKVVRGTLADRIDGENLQFPVPIKGNCEYSCSECSYVSSKINVIAHLKDVHLSVCPIFCRVCQTGFLSQMQLGMHQVIHDKIFFCNVCKREFLTKRYYNKHVKFCQKKTVVNKCRVCGLELSSRGNLRLHMISHSLKRKFQCSLCSKSYKMNRHLLKHVRCFHLKLKPFKCPLCNKSFPLKGNLTQHYSTHSDKRPYKCPYCEKYYKSKASVNVHQRKVHKISFTKSKIIVD